MQSPALWAFQEGSSLTRIMVIEVAQRAEPTFEVTSFFPSGT